MSKPTGNGFPSFISKYALSAASNIMQKNNGRSNAFKVMQYLTKVLAVHLAESDPKNVWVGNFNHASGSINTARKMLTLGAWVDVLEATRNQVAITQKDIFRKLSNYCNALYLLFDNVVFFQKVKLTTLLGEKAAKVAMCSFFFSQLFALVADSMTLAELSQRERTQSHDLPTKTQSRIPFERQTLTITLVMRICNMIYSSNGFNLGMSLVGSNFNEKTVAWSGLVAGLIALVQGIEKSLAATQEQYNANKVL